jgi:oligosaccharide translocation protein RFT1
MTYTHFSRAAAARAAASQPPHASATSPVAAARPPEATATAAAEPPHAATSTSQPHHATAFSRQLELHRLHTLLRATCIFGLLLLSLGPPYAWLLLRLVYGTAWASGGAPALLATYCAHACGMAINGVSEAYVQAAASPAERGTVAAATTAIAAGYAGAAAIGVQLLGVHGLVLANALNMAARSFVSYRIIRAHAQSAGCQPSPRLSPHPAVLAALAAAAAAAHAAKRWLGAPNAPFVSHAAHVGVGVCGVLIVAAAVGTSEPELAEGGRAILGARGGRMGGDGEARGKEHRA